jgi:GDPmannose 4,6-dehydratase
MKTAIITGVTGQDGAYLSNFLLKKNYEVIGLVRSYNDSKYKKLEHLKIKDKINFEKVDLLDIVSIQNIIRKYNPDEIYNLAAQSSVGLSFQQPIGTINFNTMSVLYILEAIKNINKNIKFYQASSSEMYGKVDELPISEKTPMHPLSPYAISKASAHWITTNYRESYNLFAVNGILFNHESYLRTDNFFIKKLIKSAVNIKIGNKNELRLGNLKAKRDFGYSPDYVEAMWLMLQEEKPEDFIICSGKSYSLREIVKYVFDTLDISMNNLIIDEELFRPVDIPDIYGDNTKAKERLGWDYDRDFLDVLDILIEKELKNNSHFN